MILTCPECATSYFVDDARIPRRGRMVKCSSCGARWRAQLESEPEPEFEAPEPPPVVHEPEPEHEPDDLEFVVAPVTPARKPPPPAKRGGGPLTIAVVALGVLGVAAAGLVAFRTQVATAIPPAAGLYEALGLSVNTTGLAFEGVTPKPILVAGRPVLAVTGAIRNTTREAVDTPPIRISLMNRDRDVLVAYELAVANGRVPAGGVRHFAWNFTDPPAGAEGVELAFDAHAKAPQPEAAHAPPPAAAATPPAAPAAAEPAAATPLKDDHPDHD